MSTFGVGQATPFSDADDYNAFAFMFDRKMDDIQTMTLVEVQAVNTTALTVDVLVLVNIITGANAPVEHEVIYGRPYLRTQGGTSGIICDPVAGDIGAMVFASRDLSAVIASKGAANPGSFRRFAWSDGVYVGATINPDPTQFIKFVPGSGGIMVVSPTGDITLDAPLTHVTGDLLVDGDTTLTGTTTMTGEATATAGITIVGTFTAEGGAVFEGTFSGVAATFSGIVTAAGFAGSGGGPGSGTVTSVDVAASNSLSSSGGPVTGAGTITIALSGDSASPGNSYYYGTNGSGVKGWYPQGGGSGTVTSVGLTVNATYLTIGGTASPITSTGTFTLDLSTAAKAALAVALTAIQPAEVTDSITWTGTDLALVGDVGSPGNNYYYGTNGSGVKGWYVISGGGGGSVSLSDGTNTISSVTSLLMLNGYAQSGGTGVGELYFPWSPDMPPVSPNAMNDEFDGSTLNARWTPWNIQGGSPLTYTIASSAITLNIPIDGGVSTRIWQGLSQPLPGSTPWGFIIKVRGAVLTSTYNYAGFIIANSSTLQGISYGLDWHSSYGEPCFFTGASPDFTAHTTNDVSHANANGGPIAPFGNQWYAQGSSTLNQITENASLIQTHWLAIVSDGNDLYYSVSLDGRNFSLLWSQSISSYFSAPPDLIIIGGESISASTPSIITLDYFRRFL